jgi:signal transduction histidine kinase
MDSATREHSAPLTSVSPDSLASEPASAPTRPNRQRLPSWLTRWSIEQRVLAGFGMVFAGIVVISAVSYRNTSIVVDNSRADTASHELIQLLESIAETLDAAENGHRRFLVTGDDSYLKAHRTVRDQAPEYFRYLESLTASVPEQQARVTALERLIRSQIDAESAAITQREKRGAEGVRHLALSGAAKAELGDIHRLIGELESTEQHLMQARLLQSASSTRNTISLLGLGALLQLVLLGSVYYLIHHDISARRRVAAELKRRGELLQAANKELEAFSYSVSHDLRAPLRHIDGYASLLSKAAGASLNDKAQRYLQTISESAKQMGQLIDDLLVFSRMGRQEMLHTMVDLNQLVKSVIHDLRLDLQGKAISWTMTPLPHVSGDPAMLRQVYANLISNAVKFTATRDQPRIDIGAKPGAPGEVILYVSDNGVGFDMQYVNKLFGVFQRLHRNDEFEGTGIGLANVRRIVHRHGGRTWAEGAIDEGATFYFSLPIKRSTS